MAGDNWQHSLLEDVSTILRDAFANPSSRLASLDPWSERRILAENNAKTRLVIDADDPVEHCHQDLIREIDSEAMNGVFLANPAASAAQLRHLSGDAGVSGRLGEYMDRLAPLLFPDEAKHSNAGHDLVWVGLEARYDRAHAEAEVSQLVMGKLIGDVDAAMDVSDALRSLYYAYHEHHVRKRGGLPALLSKRESADLATMVARLSARCGNYADRVRLISELSETL